MERLQLSINDQAVMSAFDPDPPNECLFKRITMVAAIFPSGGPTARFGARVLLEGIANTGPMRGHYLRLVVEQRRRRRMISTRKIYTIYHHDGNAWIPWKAAVCCAIAGKPENEKDVWQKIQREFLRHASTVKAAPKQLDEERVGTLQNSVASILRAPITDAKKYSRVRRRISCGTVEVSR